MSKINISYDLNKFMEYKDKNMMLPVNLKPICNEYGGTLIIRDIILKEVANVIDNFNSGKNPNDIIFKNSIIEFSIIRKIYSRKIKTSSKCNIFVKNNITTNKDF